MEICCDNKNDANDCSLTVDAMQWHVVGRLIHTTLCPAVMRCLFLTHSLLLTFPAL